MKNMEASLVKRRFLQLLAEVERRDEVLITDKGAPIALLVPYQKHQANPAAVIEEFRKWRKGITWGQDVSISESIRQNRL
ncbi:MAG: type II toxin-antitoxin system prevent-host-death family antitoxin [Parachlamydia sp.]|nr:type II toxin-antitoxin system prevent-host-death family antitoxin [Parachlamydia sp.]